LRYCHKLLDILSQNLLTSAKLDNKFEELGDWGEKPSFNKEI